MADRPAPYREFDFRGLTEEHRTEFWSAAERSLAAAIERHRPEEAWPSNAYGAASFAHLMRMHLSVLCGEPPSALNDFAKVIEFDGKMEDLDDLWHSASRTQSQGD